MARKTKEEALATRASILDAAELLFHRQGVSRTSLHDIAAAAGVTRGAVYWHFKDKADVFTQMMDRVCLPVEEGGAAWMADAGLVGLRTHLDEVFALVTHDEQAAATAARPAPATRSSSAPACMRRRCRVGRGARVDGPREGAFEVLQCAHRDSSSAARSRFSPRDTRWRTSCSLTARSVAISS